MLKRTITLSLLILSLTTQAQWKDGGTKITTTQNVGIGTENPAYKLDVVGNTRTQNLILSNGYQITRNINDNFTYQDKSVGHYSISWNPDSWYNGGGTLWQSGYGGIKFFTNSQLRIAIDHSGNVGIGTDKPQYKLDVNGDIAISSLYLRAKYTENGWRNTILEYDGHNLVIGSKEGINAHNSLVIKPGGAGKEQLYSSINLYSTSKDNQYQQKVKIITEGNSFFNAGNIGIGTDNPQHRLDVVGDIRSQNLILPNEYQITRNLNDNFTYQNKSLGQHSIGWNSDSWFNGGGTLWQSAYGGIKFFTGGQFQMGIRHSGNVGIGTDNPQYKLDVLGTIRATEVKVEAAWADFVFNEDYKLLPLEDVKAHIEAHKHLPDVPSEKEVREQGINIGEMQAKLLQKIEELTLYVIQQNERIIEQNNKNKQLELEILKLRTKLED